LSTETPRNLFFILLLIVYIIVLPIGTLGERIDFVIASGALALPRLAKFGFIRIVDRLGAWGGVFMVRPRASFSRHGV
jgi:hypothetical protein